MSRGDARAVLPLPFVMLCLAPAAGAAQTDSCASAYEVLQDELEMAALVRPDTVDDWRTGSATAGCEVLAGGGARDMQLVVTTISSSLGNAGWGVFSEPSLSPHGTTFGLGREGLECVFGVFPAGGLGSLEERELQERARARPGEKRYTVQAHCLRQQGGGSGEAGPPSA